jgi:hypothetical protein
MHRETFIAKLTEVRQTVDQLLSQLQASEHDKFAAPSLPSRREFRSVCQYAGNRKLRTDPAIDRGIFQKLVSKILATFVALAGQTDLGDLFCFVRDDLTGCDLRRPWEHRD